MAKKAKAIMIQGTMSNAGKSLLAGGLCRVFRQDGYRVAPFKSQNMALNSFITQDGYEMGRAQVMQAEAAGIAPMVEMNPILLKPTNDTGSQVIVNGVPRGNMSAVDYFRYKKQLIPDIMQAYQRLSEEFDIIVLEGAGSPAEINLKSEDIVNMGMAQMAGAPVLLAGDIDRGGVFASLAGTVSLLEPAERELLKGLIINKFRGDKRILQPGLDMIEQITGKPVVGVIPYLHVDIDDEDSLTERFDRRDQAGLLDIAVIRLPRISNFTDFGPLESVDGLTVRYVKSVRELKDPDLILLPGTKNTMGDLKWLRSCGLEAEILKRHSAGTPVMGICGGYQMLGRTLADPYGAEEGGTMEGMGLLPLRTVFAMEKTRTRAEGQIQPLEGVLAPMSGARAEGYEIHMGETEFLQEVGNMTRLRVNGQEKLDGACADGVYGTYLHGIFDSEEVVRGLIAALCARKGIDPEGLLAVDWKEYKERQYDLLAEGIRQNMDMSRVYDILEAGV
ncbi:MAG: cobyric acid synthase [Eubacteriales bacterium]|jgi:adenosylcobyric acid synthase